MAGPTRNDGGDSGLQPVAGRGRDLDPLVLVKRAPALAAQCSSPMTKPDEISICDFSYHGHSRLTILSGGKC
jgi:hypothetical protein